MLNDFGVDFLEVTSPLSSEQVSRKNRKNINKIFLQSRKDCEAIAKLGLKKSKILTHVRCHLHDAKVAIDCGVDGIDVVFGTSSYLREFSHGKDIPYIIEQAQKVVTFIKEQGLQVRFSTEDSFRSDIVDLLQIYKAVDALGVDRVGIADTVGVANPRQVYELVKTVRSVVSCDIEFHGHNDTGFAIANSYTALEAGVTHIDTSVLGIGERNGITPLGGLIAAMYVADKEGVKNKYDLKALREIENYVADLVQVNVPFNNYITGFCAFNHKAGIHTKAMLNNPETYEILNPEDFGMSRYIHIAHRLTGWNAIKNRVEQLQLDLTDEDVKICTTRIKNLSDIKHQSLDDVDNLLRDYHTEKYSKDHNLKK